MNSSDFLKVGTLSSEHPIQRFARALESPAPLSSEEEKAFEVLQAHLIDHAKQVFPDPRAARSVVVIPSLSIAPELLEKISGVQFYEERMLFALMLLRLPRTRLIYVTSQPIAPSIVDYYLNLLPGVPVSHARGRLTLLSCFDTSPEALTLKILRRPRLVRRIRAAISDPSTCHMTVFNATALERTLAVRLGIPLYGCDPGHSRAGTKSGSRQILREAEVPVPAGFEDLHSVEEMVDALEALKRENPHLKRAAIKLDEGVSGEGNATFSLEDAPGKSSLRAWLHHKLPNRIQFEAPSETWDSFSSEFAGMGGIVEEWIDGSPKRSPSMQGRIDPLGNASVVSTHDQILGGPSGQIFLGCSFPAHEGYRLDIQRAGARVGTVLRDQGVTGRFGVDFVTVETPDGWAHYGIEINIRKGGTTHPFLMLQFLTDGEYDPKTGLYRTPSGAPRSYYASDNVVNPLYRGFTPEDLTDISVNHGLHFHGGTQEGVVFHLIGALSEFGKVGVLCISDTIENARKLYLDTVLVLDHEALAQEEARASMRVFGP
jgi:pheganomycin biosynthesis PGM1-like protein